jgi:hypothetical protein
MKWLYRNLVLIQPEINHFGGFYELDQNTQALLVAFIFLFLFSDVLFA